MHLKLLRDRGFGKKAVPQLPMVNDLCRAMSCGEQRKIIEVLLLKYIIMIMQEKGTECTLPITKSHAIGFRNIEEKLNCEEKHQFQRCAVAVGGRPESCWTKYIQACGFLLLTMWL